MLGRRVSSFAIGAVILAATAPARANGRFPQAQAIVTAPGGDGRTLYMRATFGVLVSRDAGHTWSWICERALGYQGEWDPPIAVTRDGTLWAGLERGIAHTKDGGCDVETQPVFGEPVKDLTVAPDGETLYAITGEPYKASHLWRRGRDGAWKKLAATGLEELNLLTIEVAPSRPRRVYVSGEPWDTVRGRLYRSDDGGATFKGGPNDEKPNGPMFIAAVDPKDPDRVFLRHLHDKGSELLVTRDGKAFTNVLSIKTAMFGFAKSKDGREYWAGSGLPRDGVFRSTDRGAHFERVSEQGVLCLTAVGDALYACENRFKPGAPFVGLSKDGGKTIAPVASFADIRGPVGCANDAGAAICASSWAETQAMLMPPSRPDGGASDGGAPDAGSTDAGAPSHASPRKRSCGCDAVGADPDPRWLTSGLVPLALWGLARVRRGSRRSRPGSSRST